jgi:hypothetical protein
VLELGFSVVGAARVEHAAVPTLRFEVRVCAEEPVRSVLLDVQVQIAARRRGYDAAAHDRLFELFGPAKDWGTTLRTLLWTRSTLIVPAFSESTVVALDVPCSYDLEVTASRYLDALTDGVVPLEFLFSGSVFYDTDAGLQTNRLSAYKARNALATWDDALEALGL